MNRVRIMRMGCTDRESDLMSRLLRALGKQGKAFKMWIVIDPIDISEGYDNENDA